MDPVSLAIGVLVAVVAGLVLRVPIAFAIGSAAAGGLLLFFSWRPGSPLDLASGFAPTISLIGSTTFEFVHNYPLSMIPLFIGLGHVAYRAGITTDLYNAMRLWLAHLPGGLAMASVVGCGGFSAITGSSVACASAMGRIAVPEMLRFNYSPRLATGAVAAGGTLGSLIPPSILFVIYAIFTEQSVRTLFIAGIVPGLLSLCGYLLTISVWTRRSPGAAPGVKRDYVSRDERAGVLLSVWPSVLLFLVVVVGIYQGIFTPTEAAAVSLALAIAIGFLRRTLSLSALQAALVETVIQTSTIFLIAIAAKIFVTFVSLTRIAPLLVDWLKDSGAEVALIIAGIVLLYLLLGMFLDSIGILVLTLPFTVPLVEDFGLSLIWFGVIVVKLLEIGLITPPIGLNVFVIKSVAPRAVRLEDIFWGVAWFLVLDFVVLAVLLFYPETSLYLPSLMR